jgi:hypothetical protein
MGKTQGSAVVVKSEGGMMTYANSAESDTAPEVQIIEVDPILGAPAAERIRTLSEESGRRGNPMISSLAMQTRLFDVYDEVAASPEALALLQRHLQLTLERTWYRPDEIETLASQIETYLAADGTDVDLTATEDAGDLVES